MITIGRYRFDGPIYNTDSLKNAAGVYAVLDDRGGQGFGLLDVGESKDLRTRVKNHDREECWKRHRQGRACYAALYMPGSASPQREAVERDVRQQFTPACGVW